MGVGTKKRNNGGMEKVGKDYKSFGGILDVGGIAQSVERWSNKPLVAGSIPSVTITLFATQKTAKFRLLSKTAKHQNTPMPHLPIRMHKF